MLNLSPRFKANILLLSTAAIWGSGFAAQRSAILDGMGSISFTGIRFFLVGYVFSLLSLRFRKKTKNKFEHLPTLLLCSFMLLGAVLQH